MKECSLLGLLVITLIIDGGISCRQVLTDHYPLSEVLQEVPSRTFLEGLDGLEKLFATKNELLSDFGRMVVRLAF